MYIDIATGRKRCAGCGYEAEFENWEHHCNRCGGVSKGGEIWQGMAAEAGRMGDLTWLRAAGRRRGTLETTFLGWSWCLGCGRRFDKAFLYLLKGSRSGGICPACHGEAKKRHAAWFRFRSVPEACAWCGNAASDRAPRVRVGKTCICRSCTEEISLWGRAMPDLKRFLPF